MPPPCSLSPILFHTMGYGQFLMILTLPLGIYEPSFENQILKHPKKGLGGSGGVSSSLQFDSGRRKPPGFWNKEK